MEPQTASHHHRAANASLALVLAAGCFYLVAASHPHAAVTQSGPDVKQGPLRPTAVQSREPVQAPVKSAQTARSDTGVKVIGASTDSGKPCDEQTWPYIDKRCLTIAEDKPAEPKSDTNRTPLGLRDLLTGVRPAPIAETTGNTPAREPEKPQPVGSVTAIVPTPPVKDMQANTLGVPSAEKSPVTTDGVASTDDADVPMPQPRPDATLAGLPVSHDVENEDLRFAPPPPMSRAEHRHMEREQRRAVREFERERRRQDSAERRAANPGRIVRRWTEYSFDDDSRTVVIQQGSRRDRFFQNYR